MPSPFELDVANVACIMLSLERIIAKGCMFSSGDHESCKAKNGARVKIDPRGKTFVLRVRKWCKGSFASALVAPMGEEATVAYAPADGSAQPSGRQAAIEVREVKPFMQRPTEAEVRTHLLAHCLYAYLCEVRARSKAKTNKNPPIGIDHGRRDIKA